MNIERVLMGAVVKLFLAISVLNYGIGGYTFIYWTNSTFFKLSAFELPYVRMIIIGLVGWLGLVLCIASHDTLLNMLRQVQSKCRRGNI
jgi:hypothetical protein